MMLGEGQGSTNPSIMAVGYVKNVEVTQVMVLSYLLGRPIHRFLNRKIHSSNYMALNENKHKLIWLSHALYCLLNTLTHNDINN